MSKTYTIRCDGINEEGRGTFTFNNSRFSAAGLLPGEKAKVSLLYGKDKGKAVVEEILTPSEKRTAVSCPNFNKCGGCRLLHTTYENTLAIKTGIVRDLLAPFTEVGDTVGADAVGKKDESSTFHYRNKIHATFSYVKRAVVSGLYSEDSHRVVPVSECAIENRNASAVTATIRDYMNRYGVKPYNEDTGSGVIRHVLMRVAKNGDTLVVIVSGSDIFPEKGKLAAHICQKHDFVKSVVVNYNTAKTSMVLGPKDEVLVGEGFVTDEMCGIPFRISGHSFYQINTPMAERMYVDAIKAAQLKSTDRVLDAYCGIGTITSVAAGISGCKEIVGVELNASAVKDAKENAKAAGLTGLTFIKADAGEYLAKTAENTHFNCVIMDPPRRGASDKFLRALLKMAPEKIIYISCNPVTLARDLKTLTRAYKVKQATPYDM
nr:23S rRNA (uracil(1939)-C(5))-methyltransferase RlmD [Lachnospiraceae bacterium]